MELAIIWVRAMLGTKSAPAIDGRVNLVRATGDQRAEGCLLDVGARIICLMSLMAWTRPRRLALEPR
jgi:hypothetical protein